MYIKLIVFSSKKCTFSCKQFYYSVMKNISSNRHAFRKVVKYEIYAARDLIEI